MSTNTSIEWADHTFNPWWGCQRVSPGCERCYAATAAEMWGPNAARTLTSERAWEEPAEWNAAAAERGIRRRVLCASMADVFEDRADVVDARDRLWTTIARTPHLDWLLLTKRPQNTARLVPWKGDWPANVWLGTTVDDQQCADARLPHLLANPAAVRFVSVDPLLSAIDLSAHLRHVDWVLLGGQSGRGSWVDVASARSLRDQCQVAGVRLYITERGMWVPNGGFIQAHPGRRRLDGISWTELPTARVRVLTRFERI